MAEKVVVKAEKRDERGKNVNRRLRVEGKIPVVVYGGGGESVAVTAALSDLANARVAFVSDYYGDELPAGRKSLALRVTVSHPDRTPTDAEAAEVERRVVAVLARKFGAELRA